METLASIWKAIDDSNVLWMFEAAWPFIQFLGVLLAVCAVGLVWLWLAHTFGDDDDFEDEEKENPLDPIIATSGLNMVDWDAVEYDFQLSRYLDGRGPPPDDSLLQPKVLKGPF